MQHVSDYIDIDKSKRSNFSLELPITRIPAKFRNLLFLEIILLKGLSSQKLNRGEYRYNIVVQIFDKFGYFQYQSLELSLKNCKLTGNLSENLPRKSTNIDISKTYYPAPGGSANNNELI